MAELLRWYSLKDLVTYAHMVRHDYQRTLLRALRDFQAEQRLRIRALERLYFAPGICHDPTVVCWEPIGRAAGAGP